MLSYSWSTSIDAFALDDWFRFARRAQTPDCARVLTDVLLVLPLELVDEVRHHPVVKVLPAKVRVTRRRLDLKDIVVNRQQRDIKRPSPRSKIGMFFSPDEPLSSPYAIADAR